MGPREIGRGDQEQATSSRYDRGQGAVFVRFGAPRSSAWELATVRVHRVQTDPAAGRSGRRGRPVTQAAMEAEGFRTRRPPLRSVPVFHRGDRGVDVHLPEQGAELATLLEYVSEVPCLTIPSAEARRTSPPRVATVAIQARTRRERAAYRPLTANFSRHQGGLEEAAVITGDGRTVIGHCQRNPREPSSVSAVGDERADIRAGQAK